MHTSCFLQQNVEEAKQNSKKQNKIQRSKNLKRGCFGVIRHFSSSWHMHAVNSVEEIISFYFFTEMYLFTRNFCWK
jgi:hypothetical protein